MHNRVILLLLCTLLSACAAKAPQTESKPAPKTSLAEMHEDFLYLSAQDAIRQGQTELAIQFLTALTSKTPDAPLPRMQLAELLIRSNRPEQAIEHLRSVIGDSKADSKLNELETDAHILMARAMAMSGHREEAADNLVLLLIHHPEQINARLLLVSILASLNRLDEAHFAIAQGLQLQQTPGLRKIQADLFIRQNRLDEATKSLKAMQKLDPDNETPVLLLSQLAQRAGDMINSEQLLRDFLTDHPDSLLVRNALGRTLVQSGRIPEAIGIYKGIVRDTGGTPEAHATLGLLYFQTEQYEEAANQFDKAVKAAPDDQSLFYLAASLEAQNKKDEAKASYGKIGKESPLYPDAQMRLAGMELAEEKIAEAKKRTKALIADFPDIEGPYMILSTIYIVEEKFRELIDETEPAMALPDISTRLLFNRAAAFEHFKQYDLVESSLKRLLQIDPKHSEALNFLGYAYAEQGIKLDEAEKLIRRALEEKPDDGYYLDSLAWVYFKQGDYKNAIGTQKRVMELVPDDPVIHEHMGDMLWMQGDQKAARTSWSRALELKHDNPELIRKKIAQGLDQE